MAGVGQEGSQSQEVTPETVLCLRVTGTESSVHLNSS